MRHMHKDWLVAPSTRLLHLLEQKGNLLKEDQEVMAVKRECLLTKMKLKSFYNPTQIPLNTLTLKCFPRVQTPKKYYLWLKQSKKPKKPIEPKDNPFLLKKK